MLSTPRSEPSFLTCRSSEAWVKRCLTRLESLFLSMEYPIEDIDTSLRSLRVVESKNSPHVAPK